MPLLVKEVVWGLHAYSGRMQTRKEGQIGTLKSMNVFDKTLHYNEVKRSAVNPTWQQSVSKEQKATIGVWWNWKPTTIISQIHIFFLCKISSAIHFSLALFLLVWCSFCQALRSPKMAAKPWLTGNHWLVWSNYVEARQCHRKVPLRLSHFTPLTFTIERLLTGWTSEGLTQCQLNWSKISLHSIYYYYCLFVFVCLFF